MNTGFTLFFYGLSAILLSLSFRKDREKTNRAVRKALFMMLGVLPYFLIILLVTGTAFFILPPKTVPDCPPTRFKLLWGQSRE